MLPVRLGKVALIGVGLLGGSLGRALRTRDCAREVVGFARRTATLEECEETGATDSTTLDLAQAVSGAELVVLGTPIGEMGSITRRLLPFLSPGTIVTDVGSVKSGVVAELEPLVESVGGHFLGSHPMAGSEKTGVRASRADLFEGAVCVVTPTSKTPSDVRTRIRGLWESVGGRVLELSPGDHDVLVSRSSHLPHVVSSALTRLVLDPARPPMQRDLCASGFRSTSRLASGSPEMWRDIVLANRTALINALTEHREGLADFQRLLEAGDAPAVLEYFQEAKQQRDSWCPPDPPPSLRQSLPRLPLTPNVACLCLP